MDNYIDIRLRPDPEIAPHHLLGGLYACLHRALVRLARNDIGVSFPEHLSSPPSLGTHMRVHGSATALKELMATPWLNGMLDHLKLSDISSVPVGTGHLRVTRVQAKSSPARLRRRAMRRHGVDAETAMQRIPDSAAETLRLPFVQMGSQSTGQASFPLFIRHNATQPQSEPGCFSSYGLSMGATVPWF